MKAKTTAILLLCASVIISITGCGNKSEATAELQKEPQTIEIIQTTENATESITTETEIKETFANEKEEIFHKMLNTVDYFDSISGSVTDSGSLFTPVYRVIDFQCNLTSGTSYAISTSYYKENNEQCGEPIIESFENETVTNIYENTRSFEQHDGILPENDIKMKDEERIDEIDGIPSYYYRPNITNIPSASICLLPQEMTFGYLSDFSKWNITGTTTEHNRECVVIKGTADPDYGSKFGTEHFEMHIDKESGVLLWYEGYDSDNNCNDYIHTDNIKFNEQSKEVISISKSELASYSSSPLNEYVY